MLTWLKFVKPVEQEVAGNINKFKRPLLHGDIYRVQGEPQERLQPPPFITTGYAGQSWGMRGKHYGVEQKVVVRKGSHKLAWRQLITSMAFADANTSHFTQTKRKKKLKYKTKGEGGGCTKISVKAWMWCDRLLPKGLRWDVYCLIEAAQTAVKAEVPAARALKTKPRLSELKHFPIKRRHQLVSTAVARCQKEFPRRHRGGICHKPAKQP